MKNNTYIENYIYSKKDNNIPQDLKKLKQYEYNCLLKGQNPLLDAIKARNLDQVKILLQHHSTPLHSPFINEKFIIDLIDFIREISDNNCWILELVKKNGQSNSFYQLALEEVILSLPKELKNNFESKLQEIYKQYLPEGYCIIHNPNIINNSNQQTQEETQHEHCDIDQINQLSVIITRNETQEI